MTAAMTTLTLTLMLMLTFLASFAAAWSPAPDPSAPPLSVNRRDFLTVPTSAAAAAAATASATMGSRLARPAAAAQDSRRAPPPAPSAPLQVSPAGKALLPKIGIGAWAWGDSLFWGYNTKEDASLREVFDLAVARRAAFFDTAEVYGLNSRSETLLGSFRGSLNPGERGQVSIASKFAALPWRTKREDVVRACEKSVARLGGQPIDLYQIHFPGAWANEAYWDGLGDAFEAGLVRAVGVSNYGADALRAVHQRLADRGIPLSSNQIQLSLLYQFPLQNGLKSACDELGVDILAYSPLALGFLTGKYSSENKPSGPRGALADKLLSQPAYSELLRTMGDIARKRTDASLSQVALNWAISKGSVPIPGARNIRQAQQNLNALEWALSSDEVSELDSVASQIKPVLSPEAAPFPRKDTGTGLIMFDS